MLLGLYYLIIYVLSLPKQYYRMQFFIVEFLELFRTDCFAQTREVEFGQFQSCVIVELLWH